MIEDTVVTHEEPESRAAGHIVYALVQFALAVRYRKNVVILAVLVALLLGGLYYATATRYYSAKATLLVMQAGDETRGTNWTGQGTENNGLMPTFEKLITSAKVVGKAVARLRPESRVDLAEVPREKWAGAITKNLTAKTVYNTNLIDIEYYSKDPDAAVNVVQEIYNSYIDFMDTAHRGTASELIDGLMQQRNSYQKELLQLRQLLEEKKRACGGFVGGGEDNKYLHPAQERMRMVQLALFETQDKLLELKARQATIESAIHNGENLQPHMLALSEVVGREMLMVQLGFDPRDTAGQAAMEKALLDDRAKLASMEEHLGPAHSKVLELKKQIRFTEEYLRGFDDRVQQRISQLQDTRLRPMLLDMVRQKVAELEHEEVARKQEYEKAWNEVAALGSKLVEIEELEHWIELNRRMLDKLIERLGSLDLVQGGPFIRAEIVTEPIRPTVAARPSLKRVLLMALLAGLGIGLGIVYILDTLDDRFRSVEEMQAQLGVSVMAMVRELPQRETTGIASVQIVAQPDTAESEAFRTLRTALSLTDQPSQRLVITSIEPGDGKSTVLVNLAVAYAQSGRKTLLIDADLRRPGLTAMLLCRGAEGLSGAIQGQPPPVEATAAHVRPSGVANLDLLPSGARPANPAELLASPRFAELLAWAESEYDQILIDSPPALAASDTALIGRLVDGVLMVVRPLKNRRRAVMRAVEGFAVLKIPLLGTVVNRIGGEGSSGYYGYSDGYEPDYQADPEDESADELEDELFDEDVPEDQQSGRRAA